MHAPKPFEGSSPMNTWWIDKPRLLGSPNPTDADLVRLKGDGFRVLVSLLCEKEQLPNYDVDFAASLGYARHNITVRDFSPPTTGQLDQFVKLAGGLAPGTKLIVHCEGGSGRTGTFAAAYWVAKGMTAAEAIAHVRKTRHDAVETKEQRRVLAEFESGIRSRSLESRYGAETAAHEQ